MLFTKRIVFSILILALLTILASADDLLPTDTAWIVPFETQDKPGWKLANSEESFTDSGCFATSIWMVRRAAELEDGDLFAFN